MVDYRFFCQNTMAISVKMVFWLSLILWLSMQALLLWSRREFLGTVAHPPNVCLNPQQFTRRKWKRGRKRKKEEKKEESYKIGTIKQG